MPAVIAGTDGRDGDGDRTARENVHGTAIAVDGRAALLRGKPGSGKSDLAIRCMALCPGPLVAAVPMLVADDRVVVTRTAAGLAVTCPAPLAGLIEVRGVGILTAPSLSEAALVLVVDLVEPGRVERLPAEVEPAVICGRLVSRIQLTPFEASAPLKLVLALAAASEP
jgi:HPr kinase/phosphorylase